MRIGETRCHKKLGGDDPCIRVLWLMKGFLCGVRLRLGQRKDHDGGSAGEAVEGIIPGEAAHPTKFSRSTLMWDRVLKNCRVNARGVLLLPTPCKSCVENCLMRHDPTFLLKPVLWNRKVEHHMNACCVPPNRWN